MSIITAFKCDTTGKLFEDKAKYTKHIRKVAADWPAMAEAYEQARVWITLQGLRGQILDQVVNNMFPAEDYLPI